MRTLCVLAIIGFLILPLGCAYSAPCQVNTTSWPGLTGLYVIPTARLVGYRHLAIGFNESKHSEFIGGKYTDRQIRGVLTYGATDWLEIAFSRFNDMFMLNGSEDMHNQMFTTADFKARLLKEDPCRWYPEVSFAVRDVTNDTADVGDLENIHNGRKAFLLVSKRLFRNDALGRFMDVHAGVTWDHNQAAGLAGIELTVAPNASLIVEGMWDSPYVNFHDYGDNGVPGRFVFDTGLRIYPELVPGLALDLGFIGDGEFEFSFGASYVFGM
jgi:hypothetical protein